MNSNLKQPQKTINNSHPETFIHQNETKPLSSVLELEQSLINVSGMDEAMEKHSNQNYNAPRQILQNSESSLGLGRQNLGNKTTTVMQQRKQQSIRMREQNMGRNIEQRVQIAKERSIQYEKRDRRVGDIFVGGKQMKYLHNIGGYNNVVNNKSGKQKIDQQYGKGNNHNNANKQGLDAMNINLVQNRVRAGGDGVEKRERRENVGRREDGGVDVIKRVRNQIESELSVGLDVKNKAKRDMNLAQQYPSAINTRAQRVPYTVPSSILTSGLYQPNSSQQPCFGPQLINYSNSPATPITHRSSGLLWNNNSMGLGSMGVRNSGSNLSMMGNNSVQSNSVANNNAKNFMYESNSNQHHMGCLLGGLFDNSHMMVDSQNMMGGGNMSNLNSNTLLRRFSTPTNTPISTLLSAATKPPSSTSYNQHQPIYHKQPKLVISNALNSNVINKQLPTNSVNKYVINSSNSSNMNNNNDIINSTKNQSSSIISGNNSINQNNSVQHIEKDPIQQARAIVYANKDKKITQPQVIVLDSEEEQQQQQKQTHYQLKENRQKETSTNANKTLLNQSQNDIAKLTRIPQQHSIGKSAPIQQYIQNKPVQIQQINQLKTPQMPMSMPNANLYQPNPKGFMSFNNTQQQYNSYLHNYLNKQLNYLPPSNNTPLLPFNSPNTNPLQYQSPTFIDYYNQSSPQLPSPINSIGNMNTSKPQTINYSGKQYKQSQVSQRGYEFHNKYLEKTKQIYKQYDEGRGGNVYGSVDNRMRELERQQHKGVGSFLPTQAYYSQYNQYPNIIKPQHQPTNYQGNYPIIAPNRQFATNTPNISNISNSNANINSSKSPMSSSLTFKSSLTEQKQLDIINNIDRLKGGYDGLFYNDSSILPLSNTSQLYQQQCNSNRVTSQNKSQYAQSVQQRHAKTSDSKDSAQTNAPKKRNSFYLNSFREMAHKLQQQINSNKPQTENNVTLEQLQNNRLKLQKIKKQLESVQHIKKQVQKAFFKTRSRINPQCPTSTKQNESRKKVTKKDKLANKDQQKSVNSQISTNTQQKEKYVFEWTVRLKKLRQLTKKRDYDSVILIGPDFQADIPKFMTDCREIRAFVGVKRASLLKRMFKCSSEIGQKQQII